MFHRQGRIFRAEEILDWFYVRYWAFYLLLGLGLLAALGFGAHALLTRTGATPTPLAPPTLTTARLTWVEGSIRVRRAGTLEWVAADRRTELGRYDLVRTGPRSVAEIVFFDHTVVHLRPESLISIEDTSEDRPTRRRRVAWHVSSGEVNFQTSRKNVPESLTSVSTPTLRGDMGELTKASLTVADTGATDVRLFGGSGRVETKAGESVALAPSEALRVDRTGRTQVKLPLPAAPVLLEPPHQATRAYREPSDTVLLSWTSVPGAASYHVMMDDSAHFSGPFLDRRGLTDNQVSVRGLDLGRYYWRVAAQASPEIEGGFSDFARLTIAHPSQALELMPPPLFVEALELRANILHVKGTTSPGASVTVNGSRVDVRPDGSFNDFLTLEKPGSQPVVVQATGIEGGESVRRFNVTVVEP